MHIWTFKSMKEGESLFAYQIQKEFADILVSIFDQETLPLISDLSYVDYDLYSDRQLYQLINEFKKLIEIYTAFIDEISKIISFLEKAIECNEKILFDPFRESILGLNIFEFS
ncbi:MULTISPECIES: hypothetical protein [Acinetobacter]|jgi:hypothetical protein|uniref:hypothetical protein n=2 Tax=Moraxellaceae TaxID=468 RepID=UPI0009B7C83C|nr:MULTISPECIES: hypothetical protein [Acinetobacter]MBN6512946.1 hypothetical protein [Acinetobacter pittii]MBN6537923.1 hypothetical protein [Acinetobacter pittii]MCU4472772.1 hypothetical protein [Acinetobacter pittii]MCU4487453.1 hypothetical protein [Acinetobacter pittii]MCU4707089.1 hypothetical protein [Acinetobacter pittii]